MTHPRNPKEGKKILDRPQQKAPQGNCLLCTGIGEAHIYFHNFNILSLEIPLSLRDLFIAQDALQANRDPWATGSRPNNNPAIRSIHYRNCPSSSISPA